MSEITLQLNLSPGDLAYAERTVPLLVDAHRSNVSSVLAIVDCCRPQRTKIVDPDARFPLAAFGDRVEQIRAMAESLRRAGYLDEVVYLCPGAPLIRKLSQKYLRSVVSETHDYAGCALTAYLAGLEIPSTRHVLHYDADMLLYQAQGFDWATEAVDLMAQDESLVAATPRIAPPPNDKRGPVAATSKRFGALPLVPTAGGWRDEWFSTRCFLVDRQRLETYLPLMQGRLLLETLLVKYLRRGYPRSPEVMLHRRVGLSGGWRLQLATENAWLLHPLWKPPIYLDLLPHIQGAVSRGDYPAEQGGNPEIDFDAWQRYVDSRRLPGRPKATVSTLA